jgi:hypothetical protein
VDKNTPKSPFLKAEKKYKNIFENDESEEDQTQSYLNYSFILFSCNIITYN